MSLKILTVLENDFEKVKDYIQSKEPAFITAIQQAASLSTKAIAWAQSPAGVTVEAFIEAYIPQAKAWEAEALQILTSLLTDMTAVKGIESIKGIALRLLAEVLQVLDGKKLPTGIDGYLAEAQQIFLG